MSNAFVGFYWTLPVNWAGFRDLPKDAEQAAAKSKTIRYQRAVVHRYVARTGGTLVEEIVFMDVQPDRATRAINQALDLVRIACMKHKATMLYVDFPNRHVWRQNRYLAAAVISEQITVRPLEPEVLPIDGKPFDPVEHFRKWRKRHETAMADFAGTALAGMKAAMAEIGSGSGRYLRIAKQLNAQGIRTSKGRLWSVESVRKEIKRRNLDESGGTG